MNKRTTELVDKINDSINSREETAQILNKLSCGEKAEVFDELLKRINSMGIGESLKVYNLLLELAESIDDNLRICLSYFHRGRFQSLRSQLENSKSYLENSIVDLKKAIDILPVLGIASDAEISLNSPVANIFLLLSDSEISMGNMTSMAGREEESQEYYQNARDALLRLVPESRDNSVKDEEAFYFEKLGDVYSNLKAPGNLDEAISNFDKALNSPRLQKPSSKSSDLNISKGYTYLNFRKFSEAENSFKKGIDIALSIGDKEKAANNYLALANLYANHLNRFEDALSSAHSVMDLSEDQNMKMTALNISGTANLAMGRYGDAFRMHLAAANHYRQANILEGEAFARSQVASDLSVMGKHEEAIEEFRRVLEIYENVNNQGQMVNTLCQISLESLNLGAYEDALSKTKKALEIAIELKNQTLQARCLDIEGDIYFYRLHSYKDAEQSYIKALNRLQRTDDLRGSIRESLKLASVKLSLLNYEDAESEIQGAINKIDANQSGLMQDIKAEAYRQLADVYLAQKNIFTEDFKSAKIKAHYDDAKAKSVQAQVAAYDCMINALEIYRSLGMKRNEADICRSLSQIKMEEEKFQDSINFLDKASEFYEEIGDKEEIFISNNIKAHILFFRGDLNGSKKLLEESITSDISLQLCNPSNLALTHLGLGVVFQTLGDEGSALIQFLKAIDLLDSLRSQLSSGDLKISFQGQEDTLYSAVVRLYFLRGNYEKALEFAERAKSRVLLEQIRTTKLHKPEGLDKSLIDREDELISELYASIKKGSLVKRSHELDTELRSLWDKIAEEYSSSPEILEYIALRRGDSLNFGDIKTLLKENKSAILEYYVLRDQVLIFLISTTSDRLKISFKEVDKSLLRELCMSFSSTMDNLIQKIKNGWCLAVDTSNDNISELDIILDKLSFYLLNPVAESLKDLEHLYIIPHSFLHHIPIHAIPIDGQRMIEKFSISYAPSASVLKYCLFRPPEDLGRYFVFKSPEDNLPFAEPETKAILELLGGTPIADVTKDSIISDLPGKDIIHFSCHAMFNAEDALNSEVKLSSGERITASDFFKLDLSAKLVSLGACESARSQEKSGDEMIGLVRSILFAGSKSILASLWSVDDLATYILITEFYKNIIFQEMSVHNALKHAQIHLKNLTARDLQEIFDNLSDQGYEIPEEYSGLTSATPSVKIFDHVFYWAPFITIGSWVK